MEAIGENIKGTPDDGESIFIISIFDILIQGEYYFTMEHSHYKNAAVNYWGWKMVEQFEIW